MGNTGNRSTSGNSGQPLLAPIEDAIAESTAGRGIVVIDDVDREPEGDFVFAAEMATQMGSASCRERA